MAMNQHYDNVKATSSTVSKRYWKSCSQYIVLGDLRRQGIYTSVYMYEQDAM